MTTYQHKQRKFHHCSWPFDRFQPAKANYVSFCVNQVTLRPLTVTPTPRATKISPTMAKRMPRPLAKSGPTEDTFLQCGHRARAFVSVLNCNTKRTMRNTQGETSGTHKESVMAVAASDSTHARHRGHGWGDRARRQVDDPLAVGPGAGNSLGGALADEQAVARAPNVLFARRSISNRLKNKTHDSFI